MIQKDEPALYQPGEVQKDEPALYQRGADSNG
jgi:hypothetical protein